MQQTEYQIITSNTLDGMEEETKKLLDEGWQPAGPVTFVPQKSYSGYFFHEMVKFTPMEPLTVVEKGSQAVLEFNKRLNEMDPQVKELLDINNIRLSITNDGQLVTVVGDKVTDGISPNEVLMALKASKHCPMDLDEEAVLNAVEGLL